MSASNYYNDSFPIIACSSSTASNAAIAVIRISGFNDFSKISSYLSVDLENVVPRNIYNCNIKNGDIVIDTAMMVFFKGPNSYNGENIIEFFVHGNLVNINRIINLFVENKICRRAKEGEFTFRALKNKKLTLSQVEGLDLFLNATSPVILDEGNSALFGFVHQKYFQLKEKFLLLQAALDINLDFSDDVGVEESNKLLVDRFVDFRKIVDELYERAIVDKSEFMNPSIIIYGKTNSGKSAFFNNFIARNRAIVSSIEGTTRDYLTEYVRIDGVDFSIMDTAGIRTTNDAIEGEAIALAREMVGRAFFRILIINPYQKYSQDELLEFVNLRPSLICFSHYDFAFDLNSKNDVIEKSKYLKLIDEFTFEFANLNFDIKNLDIVFVDNKLRRGHFLNNRSDISNVFQTVREMVSSKYMQIVKTSPILVDRQRNLISKIYFNLNTLSTLVLEDNESDLAIISNQLYPIGINVSELIGEISTDEVLESIFSNFCIGK